MYHILAAYAATHPAQGTFKVMGHAVPALLGEFFHWTAKLFLIIAVIGIVVTLKLREKSPIWLSVMLLAVGAFILPRTSTFIAKSVSTVTKGGKIASTGASLGLLLVTAALLAILWFIVPVVRAKRTPAPAPEEEGEEAKK